MLLAPQNLDVSMALENPINALLFDFLISSSPVPLELAVVLSTFPKGRICLVILSRLLSLLKHKHIALFNQFLDLVFLVIYLFSTLVVIASSPRKY